jgi:hypothetical protein
MRLLRRTGILAISTSVLVFIATPAFAVATSNAHAETQTTNQQTTATDQVAQAEQKAADAKANAQTRLSDAKLKACQNRETAITNIMSRLSDRGQKQLALFSSIADKTETFYTQKGKTISTYDALVADLAAKKALAQTAVQTITSSSTAFTCDGTDPKSVAATFKDNLKAEITALNDYKTAVKNLIVGVKSVQQTTTTPSTTDTSKGSN